VSCSLQPNWLSNPSSRRAQHRCNLQVTAISAEELAYRTDQGSAWDRAAQLPMFCGLIGAIVSCARLSRLGPEPHDTGLRRDELVRERSSCLPSLRPSNSRRSVSRAFSRPCCVSTLVLSFPSCSQPASAPMASAARGM
jgi:hypothetical protein